jgi:hypothetical protein
LTRLIQKWATTTTTAAPINDDCNGGGGGGGDEWSTHNWKNEDMKLLQLLSNVSKLGGGSIHRYAKEVSEAFAMVDALERVMWSHNDQGQHHWLGFPPNGGRGSTIQDFPVTCYCLGDGKYPVGAASLALTMPASWEFVSIDPLLNGEDVETSTIHRRITIFSGRSQDYNIANNNAYGDGEGARLSIVIACHSHAPLEEFWNRLPLPRLCIAMPCCAQFSDLPKETPILSYDCFEVYSPKRRINVFVSPMSP